ncbi:Monothiol glutaredoxin-S1 [Ancistrocladus abbreviatus]
MEAVRRLVEEKPVVIFSKSSCCVSHSMKQLISSYGANPTVYELDEIPNGREIERVLQTMGGPRETGVHDDGGRGNMGLE